MLSNFWTRKSQRIHYEFENINPEYAVIFIKHKEQQFLGAKWGVL